MDAVHRAVAWEKEDPFGAEFARLALARQSLRAEGVAIGVAPVPYRLDYSLETADGFVTARLRVECRGDRWQRTLELRRQQAGGWTIETEQDGGVDLPPAGGDTAALADALDCDLGLSPVTNLMPMLRHGLPTGGGPIEIVVAWVSVPDLSVRADGQRYSFVRADEERSVVRFEALDGTFAADLTLDADGIVEDYPGIARRVG